MTKGHAHYAVSILGVPFHNVSQHEALEWVETAIASGDSHQVATANVDFLSHAQKDPCVKRILRECSLVLADGMPIVWASRLMGKPLQQRVTGVDLVPLLAQASAERGYGIYLLGADAGVMARAVAELRRQYPNINLVGCDSPKAASLEEMDHDGMLRRIENARPDILLVAFGNPKQERWIYMHRDRLKVPVSIGIGGTLDLLAGRLRRAPLWMQRSGLEWLYRASQEPLRLFPRYLRNALTLLRYLPADILESRSSKARTPGTITINRQSTGVSRKSPLLED
ncbi:MULTISPECIES: WecB/TagA/CpsF family glycosyltransferase [Acidobacterium]|uniref:Glycosyl transferase, WecB/TagA/CpsF family n=1 Tax=Acidobacterium capsulatum (strain ATCC 51196 / DSM 11244 / BCRC 80197 / JCM 7670 / NBRC 15755 / NCIMB 13165 / 161) TaxID=240015 RepID=C1F6E9_ACIC5|nr:MULTISPECIES: WecB/TagA/CpsF family glycosyltransferase [Acidobacterium]ACO33415.1 glycosyl transferase, WecB/TagA/CpsF family [Acidobacterium capsulatum ATCC 51196]HCT60740.1 glycosyltransferase [Acidobacterium sp.]